MTCLIIANWKMNLSLEEAIRFCSELEKYKFENYPIIAATAPYLAYLSSKFPGIEFCAQNLSSFEENGAYSGEYSASQLKGCKINFSLIGHSERRSLFFETDEIVTRKIKNCLNAQITPIICIGETYEMRKKNNYKEFLVNQLNFAHYSGINQLITSVTKAFKPPKVIVAYEPLWSIGTNKTPSLDQLTEIFEFIKYYLNETIIANNLSIVYGGSVNLANIEQILKIKNVAGVLIGKASLDSQTFIKMLQRSY